MAISMPSYVHLTPFSIKQKFKFIAAYNTIWGRKRYTLLGLLPFCQDCTPTGRMRHRQLKAKLSDTECKYLRPVALITLKKYIVRVHAQFCYDDAGLCSIALILAQNNLFKLSAKNSCSKLRSENTNENTNECRWEEWAQLRAFTTYIALSAIVHKWALFQSTLVV